MKKILTAVLMISPFMSMAGDLPDIKIQMLDSEIEKLTRERDEKYAVLQECAKSVKGFKIAGITTLSLSAVGVAANIGEASAIKKYDKQIASKDAAIKAKQEEIEKAKQGKSEEEAKQQETSTENDKKYDASIDGIDHYAVDLNNKFCEFYEASEGIYYKVSTLNDCTGLSAGQWSATFPYGIVKGEGVCSPTRGTESQPGSPTGNSGRNCWCRIISPVSSRWVFYTEDTDASSCADNCAYDCAHDFHMFADFRSALFGSFAQ